MFRLLFGLQRGTLVSVSGPGLGALCSAGMHASAIWAQMLQLVQVRLVYQSSPFPGHTMHVIDVAGYPMMAFYDRPKDQLTWTNSFSKTKAASSL